MTEPRALDGTSRLRAFASKLEYPSGRNSSCCANDAVETAICPTVSIVNNSVVFIVVSIFCLMIDVGRLGGHRKDDYLGSVHLFERRMTNLVTN